MKKHVQVVLSVCRRQIRLKVGLLLTSPQWEILYFVASPKGKLPGRPRDFGSYKHCYGYCKKKKKKAIKCELMICSIMKGLKICKFMGTVP